MDSIENSQSSLCCTLVTHRVIISIANEEGKLYIKLDYLHSGSGPFLFFCLKEKCETVDEHDPPTLILKRKPAHSSHMVCLRLQTAQEALSFQAWISLRSVLGCLLFSFWHYEKNILRQNASWRRKFDLLYSYKGIESVMAGRGWQQERWGLCGIQETLITFYAHTEAGQEVGAA